MTYRELLELYKNGKLPEDKRRELEAEIEKQDAISEYLYEEAEIPDLSFDSDCDTAQGDDTLADTIKKSIRLAFVKTGVIVGAAVLAIVLFVVFALPKLVSNFYYDPTEVVAEGEYSQTDRMSLDMAVFSEMYLPGNYRDTVIAEPRGYGAYDINIMQTSSFDGRFTNVSGKLERGKLTLYDTNTLRMPCGNAFVQPEHVEDMGAAGTRQEAFALLEKLDKNESYQGFVSLADVTDYASFYKWFDGLELDAYELWCAVYDDEDAMMWGQNIGFSPYNSGKLLNWDNDTYPSLSLLSETMGNECDAELMKTHFISMLKYLRDNGEIAKMMGVDGLGYDAIIESVESDGLNICGFAIIAKPDTLIELSRDPAVSYIYTTPAY